MWLKRESKHDSVTLTFLTISFVLYASACIFNALGIIGSVSELNQLFFGSLAAYVGRKMSFSNKFISNKSEKEEEKEDE